MSFADSAPREVDSNVVSGDTYDLPRSIETALQKNPEINKARERVAQQQGVVITARSSYLPQVRIESDFRHISEERIPSFEGVQFGTQENWAVDLIVEQSIYAGGKNSETLKQQKNLEEAAVAELAAVVNDIIFAVRERYLGVLLSRAQVDVQARNLELLEAELKSERDKLEAGTVSNFNVLRAEVALANARPTYIRAVNDAAIALEELSRVLGIDESGESLDVRGELSFTEEPIVLTAALAQARDVRPELKRFRALLRAADHGVELERADYFPNLSVFGGYGAEKSNFSASSRDEQHGWQAGARATWKLFDGFATKGRVATAESARAEAQLALSQGERNVDIEVRRAFYSYKNAIDLVAASRQVVTQAEESLRLAQARFDAGTSTQLDVLDSQVALTQARTNEVQALHDANVAYAKLEKAIGRLVNDAPPAR
jgi:outer membrane protein TolC